MTHVYCSDNNTLSSLPPHEGNVKKLATLSNSNACTNCYLRNHNMEYQIRLDGVIYEWFRDQEGGSFVFKKRNYNAAINEEKDSETSSCCKSKHSFHSKRVFYRRDKSILSNKLISIKCALFIVFSLLNFFKINLNKSFEMKFSGNFFLFVKKRNSGSPPPSTSLFTKNFKMKE
ncbi:hypothetical protein RFI_00951 [Reticulomyxa filosa]|uniref:Uncharacterized protein n=1 Tax=Reticulomyxa filosa TaxID=46433 RepID=X6PD13_RETFI|nr:hypothetical protein RFI_00951 [Reticulomyxa filosa]|eukprot:ETO36111.1 hypothetical protein RFI_00951 [Reticulomyxa filosa]